MTRTRWFYLGCYVVAMAVAGVSQNPSRADDASRFRNLQYWCLHMDHSTASIIESADLSCADVRDDPDIVKAQVGSFVENVCKSLAMRCRIATDKAALARYSNYSTTLQCSDTGYQCGIASTNDARPMVTACDAGNITPIVDGIEQIEQAGGRVSNALKRAVRAYVELCAVNRDVGNAMASANAELVQFYNHKHVGCAEAGYEGPVNECTAQTDRQFQYLQTRAVLDWTKSKSVVTQVTIATVRRWTGSD